MVGNDNILIMMMKWEDVGKAPNPLVMTAKPNHAANEIKKTINVHRGQYMLRKLSIIKMRKKLNIKMHG